MCWPYKKMEAIIEDDCFHRLVTSKMDDVYIQEFSEYPIGLYGVPMMSPLNLLWISIRSDPYSFEEAKAKNNPKLS